MPAKPGVNRPLQVHPELPYILYFEDGQNDDDHRLGIWNFETGTDVRSWPIPKFLEDGLSVFMAASSTPDLSKILLVTAENLSGNRSQTFRMIEMESGEPKFIKKGPLFDPVAISPTGDLYVNRKHTLSIEPIVYPDQSAISLSYIPLTKVVIFHPSGEELLFGASDNQLVLVDPRSGKTVREFIGSGNQIDVVSYAAQSNLIWSADRHGEIRRWNRESQPAPEIETRINVSKDSWAGTLNISADSSKIAIADNTSRLTILDADSLNTRWTKEGIGEVIYFGNKEILAYTEDHQLVMFSSSDGKRMGSLNPFDSTNAIFAAVASPNGRLLLIFSIDDEVVLWNLDSSQEIARFSADPLGRSLQEFLSVALTDNGQVITTDIRQKLMLWDAVDGSIKRVVDVPDQPSRSDLSPRNDLIAIATSNGPPSIRSVPSLETVLTIDGGRRNGVDYAFHPTEPKLVTQFVRGSLNFVSLKSGLRGPPLEFNVKTKGFGQGAQVSEIKFSPNGKILVTMDLSGNIRVWRR